MTYVFPMDKCIICEREKTGGSDICKLCSMRTTCDVEWKGFRFCCERCRGHFERIYNSSTREEKERLADGDTVI